jgi:RNA polymerase sigma-54 factor
MLSQSLVQKQTQKLVITHDLRQSIELLHMSNLELNDRIQKELLENPMLEYSGGDITDVSGEVRTPEAPASSKPFDTVEEGWKDYDSSQQRTREYERREDFSEYDPARSERKQQFLENAIAGHESLADHLLEQLRLLKLTPSVFLAGEIILTAIDRRGFLKEDLPDLIKDTHLTLKEAKTALYHIQRLEPVGCGSRDIQDALAIQARLIRPQDDVTQDLLLSFFEDLEKLDYKKIEKISGYTREQIERSLQFIRTLEPFPGTLFAERSPEYIFPDIIIEETDFTEPVWVDRRGNYERTDKREYKKSQIIINDDWMPRLKINEEYKQIIKQTRGNDADKDFLKSRLASAQFLIKSVDQRRDTLMRVMECIVEFQEDFFSKGHGHLIPLTLKEVAERVGLHESTVSRITSSKYVQTRWGTFELKYFFTSSLRGSDGDRHSARNIQDRIKQLVNAENPEKPMSDQDIVEALLKEGVEIARRTVAKYRKILKILPADRRKKINKLNTN